MSHAVSESDSFDSAVVVPDVLDTTYIASVPQGMGSLANRTRFLLNTIDSAESVSVGYSDVTAQFASVPAPNPARFANTGSLNPLGFAVRQIMGNLRMLRRYAWGAGESNAFLPVTTPPVLESSGTGGYQTPGSNILGARYWNAQNHAAGSVAWVQQDVTGAAGLIWNIAGLPPTCTIIFIGVTMVGAGSHVGLPSTMPTLTLYSTIVGTASSTTEATVTDSSANTTAYQSSHLVSTSLSTVVGQNTLYSLKVTGEASTNSLVGLRVSGLYIALSE